MLALTPEELAPTDTIDPAIDAIGASPLREIVIVGRRGPAQASWTTQELKEMGELAAREPSGKPLVVRFLFFRSPVAIHGDEKVEAVELVRNTLEEKDGPLIAVATDEHETLECGLVFRSVGYRGIGLPDVP